MFSGVPQAPVSTTDRVLLVEMSPSTMLTVASRNGKIIIYFSEPDHIRGTKAFTCRKFWVRCGFVCVCFGHSLSDPLQHKLHQSGLAGSLKPSLCLPVFYPTLSLQIDVFASPFPLAELALLLWDPFLTGFPFRSAAGIC